MEFIDLNTQQRRVGKKIKAGIDNVLNHGQYIMGPEIYELELALANYTNTKYCITVSSGTDALLISLMSLGIGRGDEVITTSFSWISTAEVIVLTGAKPVFVDVVSKDKYIVDEDFYSNYNDALITFKEAKKQIQKDEREK